MEALSGVMGLIFIIAVFVLFLLGVLMPYFVYRISIKTTDILGYLEDILGELKKTNETNQTKFVTDTEIK